MTAHNFTYTSDSCGYTILCDGRPIGGARTLGTRTRTSDGRIRHWRHVRADVKQHAESARRAIAELEAGAGPAYLRKNIPV